LWRNDHDPAGFRWIDCTDRANSVLAWERRDGDAVLLIVLNLTPVPRDEYRVGTSLSGRWVERLSTDAVEFGGSGYPSAREVDAEPVSCHGQPWSLRLRLPPLSALVLAPAGR
jgi:1,4-alpha-glucan branching enzyme